MNPTETVPAPAFPSYVSADGGAAHRVCTVDGRDVWAVRRLPGYDGRSAWAKEMAPAEPYWTTVIQTMPGREKAMALGSRRFEEDRYSRDAAMRKAVNAIVSHYAAETSIARAMHDIAVPSIVWHDADAAREFKAQTA
jgi:hypothetical protein